MLNSCLAAQNTRNRYDQYSSTDHFFLWVYVIIYFDTAQPCWPAFQNIWRNKKNDSM